MITQSKLSNQPDNKLTKKFRPIEIDDDEPKSKTSPKKSKKTKHAKKTKKTLFLLGLLLIVVAGITFGAIWLLYPKKTQEEVGVANEKPVESVEEPPTSPVEEATPSTLDDGTASIQPITEATSANPTIQYGRLMLINPNFMVEPEFIAARKAELISLYTTYGIIELHSYNGDNLMDKEAAEHLNQMLSDYTIANPGHTIQTVSCFRSVGTSCGRLCMPTGASDHHTGLTCDLIDPIYGTSLDTSTYDQHIEWQWLRDNSYKYGFIDRFPEAWAGGSMDEPMNVDANGSTGLFETWHYRYVGIYAATEIATGMYNNGEYDSLEHYLRMRALVPNLLNN